MRLAAAVALIAVARASAGAPAVLLRVEVESPAMVRFDFSAPVEPLARTLPASNDLPTRIYLDLPGTVLNAPPTTIPGVGDLLRVRTGQFDPTTARVVLDLGRALAFTVGHAGRSVTVELAAPPAPPEPEKAPPEPVAQLEPPPAVPPPVERAPEPIVPPELPPEVATTPPSPPAEEPAASAPVDEPVPEARIVEPVPSPSAPPLVVDVPAAPDAAAGEEPVPPSLAAAFPSPPAPPEPPAMVVVEAPPAPSVPPEPIAEAEQAPAEPVADAVPTPAAPLEPLAEAVPAPPEPVAAAPPPAALQEPAPVAEVTPPPPEPIAKAAPAPPEPVAEAAPTPGPPESPPAPLAEALVPPPSAHEPTLWTGVPVVVLDAGHGGRDPGAEGVGGVVEKDVVLGLARLLAERLPAKIPVAVVMTRTDDSFVPIDRRLSVSPEGAALFLSLHANACNDPTARGLEIFYGGGALRQASAEATSQRAALLGRCIQEALQARVGPVRGAPRPGTFRVLTQNPVPSALVEIGYLTHPAEAERARDAGYQALLADALIDGVAAFLRASATPTL